MLKINLFFNIIFISLFAYSCNTPEAKSINNNEDNKAEPVVATVIEEKTAITKVKIDPISLLRGELLSELLSGEMNGMSLGMQGSEPILHTMYDIDGDGDDDLFMQVLFQRGEVVQDAFVFYYNNEKPKVDPNFKPGFSADNYHQLGSDGGEPRPCSICLFEKNEENLFLFKDRADSTPLKFKLMKNKYGIEWKKQ